MRGLLAAQADDVPLLESLRVAVLAFNRLDADAEPWHRQRMALILHVPALQAHSTLRYAAWRDVVAEHAARRLGEPAGALGPRLVGHTLLGAAVAAYEQWLLEPGAALEPLLDASVRALADGLEAGVRRLGG